MATLPGLWVLLDVTVDHIRQDHSETHRWPYWFISALGWWIGAVPSCAAAFFYICQALRSARTLWMDRLTNLLVVLVMQPIFACTFLPLGTQELFGGAWLSALRLIEVLFELMLPLSPWLSAFISSPSASFHHSNLCQVASTLRWPPSFGTPLRPISATR